MSVVARNSVRGWFSTSITMFAIRWESAHPNMELPTLPLVTSRTKPIGQVYGGETYDISITWALSHYKVNDRAIFIRIVHFRETSLSFLTRRDTRKKRRKERRKKETKHIA